MGKTERIKTELQPLLELFLKTGKSFELSEYLKSNSNLPGPRGNLELAYSLSELTEEVNDPELEKLFSLFKSWLNTGELEAPVNDPAEFLVFCAVHSTGKIGSISEQYKNNSLSLLRVKARDGRWRTREAVCMGLQFLLDKHPDFVIENFNNWLKDKNFLELRAIATAYADPQLLKRKIISQNGLKTHRKIFDIIIASTERKSDDFKTLRKALGYTFSLIALVYTPNCFGVMKKLLELNDNDITWIVKENIKKNRLIKNFPERVEEIKQIILKSE